MGSALGSRAHRMAAPGSLVTRANHPDWELLASSPMSPSWWTRSARRRWSHANAIRGGAWASSSGRRPRRTCYPRDMNAPAATLEDLLAIPEEARRHELIDRVIVEKGAASGEHGGVQRRLSARIDPFERRPGGRWPGGWWFATELDVYFDPANTFRPDIAGWRRERAPEPPRGAPVTLRPDWVCEILSSNRRNDLVKKK